MKTEIYGRQPEVDTYRDLLQNIVTWSAGELKLPAESVTVVLSDDNQLRQMHKQYLNDDTYTDVITFNLGESGTVEAELYISTDRARAHAADYKVSLPEELCRLVIHGMLHLAGLDDREPEDRRKMKALENRLVREAGKRFYTGIFKPEPEI